MAIIGSTMTSDAAIAITPGSNNVVWEPDGVIIPNGLHLVDTVAEFQSRYQLTIKSRVPVLDVKTGKYTKVKKSLSLSRPHVGDDGTVEFATVRIEVDHPALDGTPDQLINLAVQALLAGSMSGYWANGSLS